MLVAVCNSEQVDNVVTDWNEVEISSGVLQRGNKVVEVDVSR